ncbi:UNVERIFIED_CONTAM: hypothetical protein GTU68_057367 [Idotea baltica]|nr:hypothetical protein [Idotea baltica]
MFEYISGTLTHKSPTYAVIDIQGVGYGLYISVHTYDQIKELDRAQLYTHLYVREDDQRLYGFATTVERDMFRYLISVSGIGTNTGVIILSSMSPDRVRRAILTDDVTSFSAVKGIGPKTAKRIILDLKEKMAKLGDIDLGTSSADADNTVGLEALSALVNLGFRKPEVVKVINGIMKSDERVSLEVLIKKALQAFSS